MYRGDREILEETLDEAERPLTSMKLGAIGVDVHYMWWIHVIVCRAWYWKSLWWWMALDDDDG